MENRLDKLLAMLKDQPNDPFLSYAVALEYATQGYKDEAISYLEALRSEQPEYLATYYQLGKQYEMKGAEEKAIAIYREGSHLAQQQGDQKTDEELRDAIEDLEEW